ncbi:DUF2185 domain-containing protein [Cytophaga hutchinsonii]|uniref:Immunity protein Imm33 domain-containing protein n=1 Tax=Cytophaga hutchinsonii (strain ATCC 33406 / DSM 1761 / CIP 103989 / NBRC 15051 / NCIMB 9469 / D465) TaxID=269798 RepID=A0A6N4SPZ1_CYTH3|nr:DUF2185 domain-containing protein [Cytophaga hutchinsonii]ABG58372.1 conserved hypothetical protein [Cytophaga hutchinsonii ATCC 33406]SFX51508.1 hypothetical protein SAMN04487930_10558 [Cytophaga hutchinsonii ATCC 33406]
MKELEGNVFENFPEIGLLMVSKMVTEEKIQPRFVYREKRTRPEDSGWRIFTGFESEDYNDDPDNIGLYDAVTILQIDPSLEDILLKGIGAVYEKAEDGSAWYKVTDFELEDDYMVTHRLTDEWSMQINNLFERSVEQEGDLLYTTGDKSVRLVIWNEVNKNKETLYEAYKNTIQYRDQSAARTIDTFDFSDDTIFRIGYMIEEQDQEKSYHVLYGFSIIDHEVLQLAFYVDDLKDLEWAVYTWQHIVVSTS